MKKTSLSGLKKEIREQRKLLMELAEVFHTHVRTDIAPDAALPAARRLLRKLKVSSASAPTIESAPTSAIEAPASAPTIPTATPGTPSKT